MHHHWSHSWFYVAQEADIPQPGDFKLLVIAEQSVIVVRDEAGDVRVFFNVCRHRAVPVCQQKQGNTKYFTCAFHGWVYNTKGNLVGLSGPDQSMRSFTERRGLTPVPRVARAQGRIFVSLNPEGESLEEYLRKAQRIHEL